MIYDYLENVSTYKGLHANLDLALNFLENEDLSRLPLGRIDLGPGAFILIQDNELADLVDNQFEYHEKYLDLHLVLEGQELIKFGLHSMEHQPTFSQDGDIGFVACPESYDFDLVDGLFTIFFPGEYHKPNLYKTGSRQVKKCVAKVLID